MGLDVTGVGAVADLIKDTIDKIFPDKVQAEKDQMAMAMIAVQGQIDTNKAEAGSQSTFVAGWRPFIGWIGGVSLGMVYIPKALVLTFMWAYQVYTLLSQWHGQGAVPAMPAYPDLGVTDLIGLLGSLLGFGWMRSQDKKIDAANGH